MPAADLSIVHGKVDELLEKARLAMRERRYTEPSGDNALLYYRSAAAADATNGEARDGLQRVATVLAGRFDEALSAGRLEEAALVLANFKAAAPGDPRGGHARRAPADGADDQGARRRQFRSRRSAAAPGASWPARRSARQVAHRDRPPPGGRQGAAPDRPRAGPHPRRQAHRSGRRQRQALRPAAHDERSGQSEHRARRTRPDRSLPAQGARGGARQQQRRGRSLAQRGARRRAVERRDRRLPARRCRRPGQGGAGRRATAWRRRHATAFATAASPIPRRTARPST